MWTRSELKTKAKTAFKRNYWRSVLVGLFLVVLTGITTFSVNGSSPTTLDELKADLSSVSAASGVSVNTIIALCAGIAGIAAIISVIIDLFIRNVLIVGAARFYTKNAEQPAKVGEMGFGFSGGHYLSTVGAMFLSALFSFLWSLLLIIPGIIKSYDYYMVPYIMADDEEITSMEALKKSKQMMRGHRWNTFVLNLSFLGWRILGAVTIGILDIFWVTPYVEATDAELYRTLKNQSAN